MKILPITKLGKWSLVLLLGFFLLFIFTIVVIVGIFKQEGGESFTDNLLISIPMLSAFGLAITALLSGIVSVLKYKERALLVYLLIILGLIITLYIFGDLITPH
jgi:hypothetical protein